MNVPDRVLVDMVANHLFQTPGVDLVPSPRGIEHGHSYTACVEIDMHDTVDLGPWTVRYSTNSVTSKLSVIMQDRDEPAVDAYFVTEQEGKRRGTFVDRQQWAEDCGEFGDRFQREVVLAILTNGEFHAGTPDYLKDYQKRYRDREAANAGEGV